MQSSKPKYRMMPTNSPNPMRAQIHNILPLRTDTGIERESLRWPPHLEHAEIVRRLVEIRDFGPLDTGALLANVETRSPARIAAAVIVVLAWVQDRGGHEPLTHQLQILALNLKNLH